MTHLSDQVTREQALDASQSFIIQAPAGSGKTELLTQRFLNLLATVKKPEEIIAITFTRKAAAQMRERIINALQLAQNPNPPTEPHKKTTWQLATRALAKDQQLNWSLLNNPNRLRILTIDALAAYITTQMPILANFGGQIDITENAMPFYQQAARELIIEALEQAHWQESIQNILLHLGNNAELVEQLFAAILAKREQWLPYIIGHSQNDTELKQTLQQALSNLIIEKLTMTKALIDPSIASELLPLARSAALFLQQESPKHPFTILHEINALPKCDIDHLPHWRALAQLLLTSQGDFRKTVDKRCGFAAKSESKQAMQILLASLCEQDDLQHALAEILLCPPPYYDMTQWQTLEALLKLLPLLCAKLYLIFREHQCVDFVELNLAALQALGTESEPTDLALYLDNRIQHILVDEFQDTSIMQFRLLEQLTAGWQQDDGRTLFLVGDPMQSIYRFRNAEVGLFLRAQQQGIGEINLNSLQLKSNFRSEPKIVEWINNQFNHIFPHTADITKGAVPFTSAHAANAATNADIKFHPVIAEKTATEGEQITSLIQTLRTHNPGESIAILVRSRRLTQTLIPYLQQANLDYSAVEIDVLCHREEIQDLLTLTRALSHHADRTAWLALLRAPWCGLTLNDLFAISEHTKAKTLWEGLSDFSNINALSVDGKKRCQRIVATLQNTLAQIGRQAFADLIKGTWIALGGPACITSKQALQNCMVFFKLLHALKDRAQDIEYLTDRLNNLFAEPFHHSDNPIQIMTIHKSKGLEFDHVILPGLQGKTPADKSQLLMWLERPNRLGDSDLLLAPIKAQRDSKDPIYQYLREVEKEKLQFEMARLLYVAATRAKKSLHLLAHTAIDDNEPTQFKAPPKGSFLAMLWNEQYAAQCQQTSLQANTSHTPAPSDHLLSNTLYRLPTAWQAPITTFSEPVFIHTSTPTFFDIHNFIARIRGTVIHKILEKITIDGLANWSHIDLEQYHPYWIQQCIALGMTEADAQSNINIIHTAIEKTLKDPQGRWILSPHQDAHAEYKLTGIIDKKPVHVVIDRTFIDEQGTRWIIDYKTATPQDNEPLEQFIQREQQQYAMQLQQYANLISLKENRAYQIALYFPLCTKLQTYSLLPTI